MTCYWQTHDMTKTDLDVILAEADRFVRVSVAPDVEGDHAVAAAGEVLQLVPPHVPELREPVHTNLVK